MTVFHGAGDDDPGISLDMRRLALTGALTDTRPRRQQWEISSGRIEALIAGVVLAGIVIGLAV